MKLMVSQLLCVGVVAVMVGMMLGAGEKSEKKEMGRPWIVAHRGASLDAPENTVAAYELAWERGADAAEVDVHLSKDGKLVCFHDTNAKRTTGVDRKIKEMTFAEIRALDAGSFKDEKYRGEKVPTLMEVLETVPDGRVMYVEIKAGVGVVPVLREVLEANAVDSKKIRIIAFSPKVIKAAKEQMPHIEAYLLIGTKWSDDDKLTPSVDQMIKMLKDCGADGADMRYMALLTDEVFGKMRAAGFSIHVYTIDDPEEAKHYAKLRVDSITTNRPKVMIDVLEGK